MIPYTLGSSNSVPPKGPWTPILFDFPVQPSMVMMMMMPRTKFSYLSLR